MLGADALRPVFDEFKTKIVVADLSTNDQRIWKELIEKIGDRGLPVNLVYSPEPDREPIRLPKILSVANVTEAVREAGRAGD